MAGISQTLCFTAVVLIFPMWCIFAHKCTKDTAAASSNGLRSRVLKETIANFNLSKKPICHAEKRIDENVFKTLFILLVVAQGAPVGYFDHSISKKSLCTQNTAILKYINTKSFLICSYKNAYNIELAKRACLREHFPFLHNRRQWQRSVVF